MRRAVLGARSSSARMAPDVCSRARSSSTCPSSTSTVMTAAASKYTATVPSGPRNAGGNSPGNTMATTLYSHATPVPMAMSVNMLRLRVTSDCHPRTKNGQPAHSTTGVANTNWSQFDQVGSTIICRLARWPPISTTTTGSARASPSQKRRLISTSSGFGSDVAATSSGSSAMPQIGQAPGPTWRICGCIGQV